jgi:hypothetical protein
MLEYELEEMIKREEIVHQLRKIIMKISVGQELTEEEKELFRGIQTGILILEIFEKGE